MSYTPHKTLGDEHAELTNNIHDTHHVFSIVHYAKNVVSSCMLNVELEPDQIN